MWRRRMAGETNITTWFSMLSCVPTTYTATAEANVGHLIPMEG